MGATSTERRIRNRRVAVRPKIPIKMSVQECVTFSKGVLLMLNKKGFHVDSLPEALSCLEGITNAATMIEIQFAMEAFEDRLD